MRARGGTRTAFQPLKALGCPEENAESSAKAQLDRGTEVLKGQGECDIQHLQTLDSRGNMRNLILNDPIRSPTSGRCPHPQNVLLLKDPTSLPTMGQSSLCCLLRDFSDGFTPREPRVLFSSFWRPSRRKHIFAKRAQAVTAWHVIDPIGVIGGLEQGKQLNIEPLFRKGELTPDVYAAGS